MNSVREELKYFLKKYVIDSSYFYENTVLADQYMYKLDMNTINLDEFKSLLLLLANCTCYVRDTGERTRLRKGFGMCSAGLTNLRSKSRQ